MLNTKQVKQLISTIRTLPPFPNEQFIHRLFNKIRNCQSVALFSDSLPQAERYGEDPDSLLIDGVDVSPYLELFGEISIVQSLASLDNEIDKYNLRGCLDTANAQPTAENIMTNISSLLYGEHINWYLRSKNVPSLATLAKIPGFADAFANELQVPRFVRSEVYTDMVKRVHDYSLSLLYICEYLHQGGGIVPLVDEEFALSASGKVLDNWIRQLFSATPTAPIKDIVTFCSKSASLVHAVTSAGLLQLPKLADIAKSIFSPSLSATDEHASEVMVKELAGFAAGPDLATADSEEWKYIAAMNMALWANTANLWTKAVVEKTVFATSTIRETATDDGSQFGRGLLIGVTAGAVDHQDWEKTTTTGQVIADWITQGRKRFPAFFSRDAPSVKNVEKYSTNNPAWGSCFVAGTQIETSVGPVAIEDITEGTKILTDATSQSYGIASDEAVVTPLSAPFLVGINGGTPFFTPGHVFHTTTGLRAVEPRMARRENQWINVGKLKIGHVLYRLGADGKSYDVVKVNSLEVEKTDLKVVHGVHLREGYRRYHANGFLVAMNYPEITVKSIARMLSTFSKDDRIKMLQQIGELQPLFSKFGVATISDVLTKELQGDQKSKVSHPAHIKHHQTSNLQHVRRTFQFLVSGENSVPGYVLPSLALHEGVVLVDGKVEPRASINPKTKQICWTRESAEHGYEHGFVELVNPGLSGRGCILLSDDPDLQDIPTSPKIINFMVTKVNVQPGKPFHELNHATVQQPSPTPQAAPPVNKLQLAKSLIRLPSTLAVVQDPGTIDGEDYYDLIVDKAAWPKGTEKDDPTNPTSFGQVAFATYHTDVGPQGLSIPVFTIPILDQLRDAINKTRTQDAWIGPLYSSVTENDANTGNIIGTITLDQAALIGNLADKPSNDSPVPTLGLTFQQKLNAGTLTLPILFQTMVISFDWSFSELRGAAYVHDPNMSGCLGERHLITTNDDDSFSSFTNAVRSANADVLSKSPNVALNSGLSGQGHVMPAPVTLKLAAATALTMDTLTGLSGYNEVSLHATSQTLLQNMMYYHMNDSDRTQFIQFPKPTNLPIELTENLPQNLKTWIHDVYAPAYITFMISQVDSKDVTWRGGLTDDEKAKSRYWWSGAGTTCLSRAKEYNDINAITATAAMDSLYGTTLRPYVKDGGSKWAKAMLKPTSNDNFLEGLLKSPMNGGVNLINKYCNILQYLDPTTDSANDLFKSVLKHVIKKGAEAPYLGLDDPTGVKGEQWLFDAMTELGTMVLDNDSRLDPSVRASLQDDLTKLQTEYGDLSNLTNRQRMQTMLTLGDEFLGNMSRWMSVISTALGNAFKGFSGFKRAGAVYDKVISVLPKANTGKAVLLKGIATLAMTGLYLGITIQSYMKWDMLDGAQRASVIISTMLLTVDIATRSLDVFNSYKAWKGGNTPTKDQTVDAAVLDQGTGDVIMSDKTVSILEEEIVPDAGPLGLKGAVATRQVEFGTSNKNPSTDEKDIFDTPIAEDDKSPLPPVPASSTRAAKSMNSSAKALRLSAIILGIALTVSMSISLKDHWNDMNTVGKVLNTVLIIVQSTSVLVDAGLLMAEAGTLSSWPSASASLLSALPAVGAVLAIIGITISVVLMFIDTSKKKDPPPTPVETFLQNVAHPSLQKLNSPPVIALRYDIPASLKAGSSPASVTFSVTNPSSQTVTLAQTQFNLEGGDDDACLFTSAEMTSSNVTTNPGELVSSSFIPNSRGVNITSYELDITGVPPAVDATDATADDDDGNDMSEVNLGQLVLKPGQSFTVTWTGIINKIGTTTLEIIETLGNGTGDRCHLLKTIQRV